MFTVSPPHTYCLYGIEISAILARVTSSSGRFRRARARFWGQNYLKVLKSGSTRLSLKSGFNCLKRLDRGLKAELARAQP